MRQSQSGTSRINEHGYKNQSNTRTLVGGHSFGPGSLSRSAAVTAIGIMVSAWLIVKALVAFAPVYAQYGESSKLPLLLDATGEELTTGLEMGHFTSVDLVQVSINLYKPGDTCIGCRYIHC
jgi:3-isopropylmalate dehydratase small subunit